MPHHHLKSTAGRPQCHMRLWDEKVSSIFKNTPLDACGHGKPETVTITYPFGPFSGMTVKVTSVLRCSNRTYIHFVTDNDVKHSVPSEWTDYNEQMYGTKDVGTRTCKFSYDQLLELNKYLKTIIKS